MARQSWPPIRSPITSTLASGPNLCWISVKRWSRIASSDGADDNTSSCFRDISSGSLAGPLDGDQPHETPAACRNGFVEYLCRHWEDDPLNREGSEVIQHSNSCNHGHIYKSTACSICLTLPWIKSLWCIDCGALTGVLDINGQDAEGGFLE